MGELLLDLILGEPLALVKKLPWFDIPKELYILLVGALQLVVHNSVHYSLLIQLELSSVVLKCFSTHEESNIGGKYG